MVGNLKLLLSNLKYVKLVIGYALMQKLKLKNVFN